MAQHSVELYYRKAREMKGLADTSADPGVREQLMLLAERYERLALHADSVAAAAPAAAPRDPMRAVA